METTERTFTVLTPTPGHTLVDDLGNLSKQVWLAVNDTPSRWREITDAEADALRNAAEAQADEQQPVDQPQAEA